MLRKWGTTAIAAVMVATSATAAFAGTDSQKDTLAPGGAAGVEQAQFRWMSPTGVLITAATLAALTTAIIAFNNGGKSNPASSTTSPPTN